MPSWIRHPVRWLTSAAIALGISYVAVCWLLGLRWSTDEFDGVRAVKGELRQVLAFEQGGHVSAEAGAIRERASKAARTMV
jgi:hypothetical protein